MLDQYKNFFVFMILSYGFFLVTMLSIFSIVCHLMEWDLELKGVFSAAGFGWFFHTIMAWRAGVFHQVFEL